ncbi:hypothetical protein [Streptomyces globisporus]|uniref:hypothetical protein n=1 Tax=Streptomyces globisporus TaxID=1908 RepID=UPI002F90A6E1|nr:hypothetical protein OG838_36075 [Streptomyces globisporus]WSV94511.1 hypothetical protein OG449_34755 [Streptomyces globisporus]
MSEHDFDLPPKATPDVMRRRTELAGKVRDALTWTGLPVCREDSSEAESGVNVRVDPLSDGGVLAEWNTREEFTSEIVKILASGVDSSNLPQSVRHYENVQTCMRETILNILASAGFDVERADVHSYGKAVHVRGFDL